MNKGKKLSIITGRSLEDALNTCFLQMTEDEMMELNGGECWNMGAPSGANPSNCSSFGGSGCSLGC